MAVADSKLLSDHFTPWSSPYHLLHPFMQPIMPTTILVFKKNIFYSLGGAWAWNLKFEQLGPHREKQQNLEKQKTQAKPKKQLLGECLVLTQTIFFLGFPSFFLLFFGSEMENPKQHIFFVFWMDMINQDLKKQQTTQVFFSTFSVWFSALKSLKNKNNLSLFGIFRFWFFISIQFKIKKKLKLFFYFRTKKTRENPKSESFESKPNILSKVVFFGFARVLCFFLFFYWFTWLHLCPYACLPYLSWKVKLWSKFLTQELAHYVRLSLAWDVLWCLCTWKLAVAALSCSISSNFCANLGILEPWIRTYRFLSSFDIFKQSI